MTKKTNFLNLEPTCIWFTGLSGSGKSTLANALVEHLRCAGKSVYVLDGDILRYGLNSDLGFSAADRIENMRRVSELARLMVDAGLIVIVALISPFKQDRDKARTLFKSDQFIEVYVNASLLVCEARDIKGLYRRARKGEIENFTGIDSPYEPPVQPEIVIDSARWAIEDSIHVLLEYLINKIKK